MSLVLVKVLIAKLKNILQCRWFYYVLLLIVTGYVFLNTCIITRTSKYNIDDNCFIVDVLDIKQSSNSTIVTFEGREKLISFYKDDFPYQIGDQVKLYGSLTLPKNNTIPNLFNYRKYLYYEGIFYIINVDKSELIASNHNVFNRLKNYLVKHLNQYKSAPYLQAFILGDTSYINKETREAYQNIGVSHLLAIGGMHISMMVIFLDFVLKKCHQLVRFFIIIIFLLIYLFLVDYQISIVRSALSYILLSLNKFTKLKIKYDYIMILVLSIVLFINPFNIYHLGFQYSYLISFILMKWQGLIKGNYLKQMIIVSLMAFICSMPITIANNFQINYLSVLYNLFYVPFINFLFFPLTLLTFIICPLDNLLSLVIIFLEKVTLLFNNFDTNIILRKPDLWLIIVYYLTIFYIFNCWLKKKYHCLCLFIIVFLFHYNYNFIFKESYLVMLDVSQGDSIVLHHHNQTWLIDVGGRFGYDYTENIIAFLKSQGIRKIEKVILTHGDFDHLGSSYNLVKSYLVEEVWFNNNEYNDNENRLITILKEKNIKYYKLSNDKLSLDNAQFYMINPLTTNENDASIVLYGMINNYRLLLMGDASVKTEEAIIDKYKLEQVDIFKVGHHGSITSSGKNFIDIIKPKISLISVGENNGYGHPSNDVLKTLQNSSIYQTSKDGSILIYFNKNSKLLTYKP